MQAGLDKAFCASFNQQKVLFTRTQRKQHFATKRELLQKRGRHMACCSGQNDGVERCRFRQTLTEGEEGSTMSDWAESARFEVEPAPPPAEKS